MLYLLIVYLKGYQQMPNSFVGHYKTLKTLVGKKSHQVLKDIATV